MTTDLDTLEHGLTPIPDIPDWCNTFLLELLTNEAHFGTMNSAAKAVGRTWYGVDYWRKHNATFANEVGRVHEAVNQAIDDEIEKRILELSLGGLTETTVERIAEPIEHPAGDEDDEAVAEGAQAYRYIRKTKHYHDLRSLQWLLERRRRQRYGPDADQRFGDGANTVTFKFVLGDEKLPDQKPEAATIEGEIISETDEPADNTA